LNPDAAVGAFSRSSAGSQRYLSVDGDTTNSRGFGLWALANRQTFLGSNFATKGVGLGYLKGATIFK